MTRDEQLTFCKRCLHRKMDMSQGLLCALTQEKATFSDTCPDFEEDKSVKIILDDENGLQKDELKEKLSPAIFERLRYEQNLSSGILGGIGAAIIGALIWSTITVITGYQIGYIAIVIGLLVGFAVRILGKGIDKKFGFFGAGIALFGVVLGNFFSIIGIVADTQGFGYFETFLMIDYYYLPELMQETFSYKDLLFYALAIAAGYKFSFRLITQKSLQEIRGNK